MTENEGNRRRRRAAWWVLAGAVAVAAAFAGYRLVSSPSAPAGQAGERGEGSGYTHASPALGAAAPNDNCVEPSNGNGNCAKTFSIVVGTPATLYPGVVRQLPLTWNNPNSFDILVDSYKVVASTTKAGCAGSYLQLPTVTLTGPGRIAVASNKATTTQVSIMLQPSAPSACQRAVFKLDASATAVKK